MKQLSILWLSAVALAMTLSSCDLIGGIFKAGFWVGVFIVVAIIAVVLWLFRRMRR